VAETADKHNVPSGEMASLESYPTDHAELAKIVNRAQKGDTSTLPVLRRMLENPEIVNNFGGNLAVQVERSIIEAIAGADLVFKLALYRKLESLRAELAGPTPSPLERLMAERAATCWLFLHDLELRLVQAKKLTIADASYRQRALDRAQKRYLGALKALATVRRLAVPVLQVNIAKNQVNKAAGS
jgi:hypothetical protein